MPYEQSNVKERANTGLRRPRRFTVVIHNDDFTTMEFVVFVLMTVFRKTEEEATQLMLEVHHIGRAPVATYSYDIATSMANRATELARAEGFPLRLTVEPAYNE